MRSHKRPEREREQLLHCERFFSLIDWYTKGEGLSTKRKRTCLEISESYSIQSWFSRQFPSRLPSLSELITLANSFFSLGALVSFSPKLHQSVTNDLLFCLSIFFFLSNCQNWSTHSKLQLLRKISLNTFSNPSHLFWLEILDYERQGKRLTVINSTTWWTHQKNFHINLLDEKTTTRIYERQKTSRTILLD